VERAQQPDPILGAVLRGRRETKGLTREATAYHAGLTTGALAQIEYGRAAPAFATVRRVAHALGMSLSELALAIESAESSTNAV
jgi:transcriptional regulator with XRE-family HTH domain